MIYADYAFYISAFSGRAIPETDFLPCAARASDYIDYITMGRAAKSKDAEALGKACCAIAEIQYSASAAPADGAALQSQSVGSWSATYRTADEVSASSHKLMMDAARRYLAPTGLLYRGVC